MPALLMTLYALCAYACFTLSFLGFVVFVGDLPLPPAWSLAPKTIDGGAAALPPLLAAGVDLLLVALFGLQHSVMARPAFKRWWTRWVPEPIERSTYVLAAALMLSLVMALWQPIAVPVVWSVGTMPVVMALEALRWAGWGLVGFSTFLIDHFELFGLRQVWARMHGRTRPAQAFRTPLLYRHVRHPLYLGFLIAFWATPQMSAGHLLFALAMTVYILIGIHHEERDLVAHFGERYRRYREQVGMLLPRLRHGTTKEAAND